MARKEPRTRTDLQREFATQVQLLKKAADLYDADHEIEVKNMVVRLRVLLHDAHTSKSLLGQLNKKNQRFYDTAIENESNVKTSYCGLAPVLFAKGKPKHVALLDDSPQHRWVDFDDWWNAVVFIDTSGCETSRKELVLTMADQDGGAHVDPEIDRQYLRLSIGESLGRKYSRDGRNWFNMQDAILATIRQITHEALRSLNPNYRKKPMHQGNLIFMGGIKLFSKSDKRVGTKRSVPANKRVGRNEPCPCGSGKKYKKCCGKKRSPQS